MDSVSSARSANKPTDPPHWPTRVTYPYIIIISFVRPVNNTINPVRPPSCTFLDLSLRTNTGRIIIYIYLFIYILLALVRPAVYRLGTHLRRTRILLPLPAAAAAASNPRRSRMHHARMANSITGAPGRTKTTSGPHTDVRRLSVFYISFSNSNVYNNIVIPVQVNNNTGHVSSSECFQTR